METPLLPGSKKMLLKELRQAHSEEAAEVFDITISFLYPKVTSCLDKRREGKRQSGIYELQFGNEKRNVFF